MVTSMVVIKEISTAIPMEVMLVAETEI